MEGVTTRYGDVSVRQYNGCVGSDITSAVIMIQEWWGITEQLEVHAAYLAKELKCAVIVPDLYDGKKTLEAEEAEHLMNNLDWQKAVERLGNCAKELPTDKVACLGFCMGGALSVATATNVPDAFKCGITFYGVPPKQLADASKCKIPMQGHFGGRDNMKGFSDPETAKSLESDWKSAGIEYEMYAYPTVGHAFMNNLKHAVELKKKLGQIGDKEDEPKHDTDAIDLAWDRTLTFLKKHL